MPILTMYGRGTVGGAEVEACQHRYMFTMEPGRVIFTACGVSVTSVGEKDFIEHLLQRTAN